MSENNKGNKIENEDIDKDIKIHIEIRTAKDKSLCLLKTIGIVLLVLFGAICIGMGIVSFFVDIEAELWLALIICSAILLLAIIICLTVITVMCLKNKTKTEELKSQKSNANEMLNAYQTIFGDKKCENCDLNQQG